MNFEKTLDNTTEINRILYSIITNLENSYIEYKLDHEKYISELAMKRRNDFEDKELERLQNPTQKRIASAQKFIVKYESILIEMFNKSSFSSYCSEINNSYLNDMEISIKFETHEVANFPRVHNERHTLIDPVINFIDHMTDDEKIIFKKFIYNNPLFASIIPDDIDVIQNKDNLFIGNNISWRKILAFLFSKK